ncbi:hypothetical protein DP939_00175 [Spongiactinospora rosea]|uniref:SAF domain-containing protein n=1 Tax=Spongiactinospora rosea TaxID=2248750 RepID=A0A366M6G8_9ACTN|nr:SAF domain-containing protein [Spongiactinospora rosea]RBQ21194.1 hypothetical protein DP939_00175 [Spongiactinospora rosea]
MTVPKLPHQPRQRRRGLLLVGLLAMTGGGVLAAQTVQQLSSRSLVVVMTRDVPIGRQVTANDMATTLVGAEPGVATVPGDRLPQIVGTRAAVTLLAGTLLSPKATTDQLTPAPQQQLVPIAVKPSRLPARGFAPGDPVLVMPAPDPTTRRIVPTGIAAVVDQVKEPDTDGMVVVDLLVSDMDGPKLASLAADGRVALVLTPRRQ